MDGNYWASLLPFAGVPRPAEEVFIVAVPKNTFSKPSNLVGGQVLWGRVLIIGGVLVLAFVVGILIGGSGSDGVSRDAYNDAISQRDKAEQEREQLKQDLQLARSTTPPSTEATDSSSDSQTQTYTVKDGDTWASISKKFYGDSSLASEIWDANNMTKDTKLKVGMTLEIPPKPESASSSTTTTTKAKSKSTTTTTTKPKSSSKSNN